MTQQTAQSLGQLLSQARLDSGKSLQELYEETLVSVKYLTALEQNAFDELPSAAYIKGYVRRIAEALGTPAEPLIAAYDNRLAPVATITPAAASTVPAAAADDTEPCHASSNRNYFVDLVRLTQHLVGYLWSDIFPWIRDRLPGKRLLLILLLLAIAVITYRLWPTADVSSTESIVETEPVIVEEVQTTEPMSEVSVPDILAEELPSAPAPSVVIEPAPAAVPEPIPAPAPAPAPVPAAGPDRIEMNFYGPSVVRVTDADGKPIASGLKRAGDSIRARGRQPFKIQVGNPDVTDIRVNGIVVQGTPL
ncbi:MAG: DUF4115 domain-containing protein [Moraxellaceae bacterium]|nr:DUF4115 domain-containing protein [Moraxellaceae bacterium]